MTLVPCSLLRRLAVPAVALAALTGGARADTVHLVNGRSFEDVVAWLDGDQVRIRFDYGEMSLPREAVAGIESGTSELTRFEERWETLARAEAPAEEWLDLARWARGAGLDHGAARAAVRASVLDPTVEGLAPLLAGLGFVQDETSGAWLPLDEMMARRGWVRRGSDWIPPEQAAALRAAMEDEEARRLVAVREERMLRAMELLALTRIAEQTAPPPQVGLPLYPVVVLPGHHGHHGHHGHGGGFADTPANRETLDDLLHRNPGSLFTVGPWRNDRTPGSSLRVEPGRSHHGGMSVPP
jgi:hypothetical protein